MPSKLVNLFPFEQTSALAFAKVWALLERSRIDQGGRCLQETYSLTLQGKSLNTNLIMLR